MKRITLLLAILISAFHFSASAQDMTLSKDSFEGNFVIDSTFTRDGGKTFEVSASGDAGPYGRVYLSYVFTDKQNLGIAGEYYLEISHKKIPLFSKRGVSVIGGA
jgi:hypothetical protein